MHQEEDMIHHKERGDEISEASRSSCQTQPPIRFKDHALMNEVMNAIEPLNFEKTNEHNNAYMKRRKDMSP